MDSFGKWISFQEISQKGIQGLSPIIETLAQTEGLGAHEMAAKLRRTF